MRRPHPFLVPMGSAGGGSRGAGEGPPRAAREPPAAEAQGRRPLIGATEPAHAGERRSKRRRRACAASPGETA